MIHELQSVRTVPGFHPNLVIQPLPEAAISAGKKRGGSAAGIDADGPLTGMLTRPKREFTDLTPLVVLLTTLWDDAADDDAMNDFVNKWVEKASAATRDAGRHHPWLYINYANKEQDPFAGYGEENLQRLRSIQRNVDANGVFSSSGLCKGYFKLL